MKFQTIGMFAMATGTVDRLTFLEAKGFNLTKKVFEKQGEIGTTYYQAETLEEDRELRLSGMNSFFLSRKPSNRPVMDVGDYR